MDFCYAGYIFSNFNKSLKKESYEKSDDFIDDCDYYDDDNHDDYDDDDYFDVNGNDPDDITDVKLEVPNTEYTKAKWHVLS